MRFPISQSLLLFLTRIWTIYRIHWFLLMLLDIYLYLRLGNQPCLLWVARPSPCVFSFGWGPVTETLLLIFLGLRADWLIVLYFLTYRATSNSKTTKFHTWLPKFNGFKPDVGFSYESTMFFLLTYTNMLLTNISSHYAG